MKAMTRKGLATMTPSGSCRHALPLNLRHDPVHASDGRVVLRRYGVASPPEGGTGLIPPPPKARICQPGRLRYPLPWIEEGLT